MQTKPVQQSRLVIGWLLLWVVSHLVGGQETPGGAKQSAVALVETRDDDHSNTNEPPRDKRFFPGFNGNQQFQPTGHHQFQPNGHQQFQPTGHQQFQPNGHQQFQPTGHQQFQPYGHQQFQPTGHQQFQPTVPFESLASYVLAKDGRIGDFTGRIGNPQFRTGKCPQSNMWPWGYGDSSQGGWPYSGGYGGRRGGYGGRPGGSWGQRNWGQWGQGNCGQWGQARAWNQFGGRPVSGPWGQSGRRSGNRYGPSYGYGYGYGFRR